MIPRTRIVLALPLVLVVFTGCQKKFTRANFELITIGVDDQENVRHMIGKPTSDLRDQWFYDDFDDHYSAVVYFDANGRVSGREWMDSVTGQWEGRNPHADDPPPGEVRERHQRTRRYDD